MSSFDALQPQDTFDRAAALIQARPRRSRRRPAALAVALVVAVGACVTPVRSSDPVGFAVEWTTYGSVGPGHYTLRAVDAVVPVPARLAIETRSAERPEVPDDHDWPPGARWTRVRYVTGTLRRADAEAWADTVRARMGAYDVRVAPVVRRDRQLLGAVALGRIGQAVSPSDPEVSDRELQALIDAAFRRARAKTGEDAPDAVPQVLRLPNGRRFVTMGERIAIALDPGVRLWLRPDAEPYQWIDFEGLGDDHFLMKIQGRWVPESEIPWQPAPKAPSR